MEPAKRRKLLPKQRLPFDLFLPIFEKMNYQTLCRFRQTCKTSDQYVEKHRFLLSNRPCNNNLVLFVEVTDHKTARLRVTVLEGWLNWKYLKGCYTLHPQIFHKKARLKNPYLQLSGINFNLVGVNRGSKRVCNYWKRRLGQATVWKNQLIPLLEQLKLNCNYLFAAYMFFPTITLPQIKCSAIYIDGLSTTNDQKRIKNQKEFEGDEGGRLNSEVIQSWPLQNCKDVHVQYPGPLPVKLAPLVRNFYSFVFELLFFSTRDFKRKFKKFLLDLVSDPSAKGELEYLALIYSDLWQFQEKYVKEFTFLWKLPRPYSYKDHPFRPIRDRMRMATPRIYKLDLVGEIALLFVRESLIEVNFIESSRQALFDTAFSQIFPQAPIMPSLFYDKFMAAESDEAAFNELNRAVYDSFEPAVVEHIGYSNYLDGARIGMEQESESGDESDDEESESETDSDGDAEGSGEDEENEDEGPNEQEEDNVEDEANSDEEKDDIGFYTARGARDCTSGTINYTEMFENEADESSDEEKECFQFTM